MRFSLASLIESVSSGLSYILKPICIFIDSMRDLSFSNNFSDTHLELILPFNNGFKTFWIIEIEFSIAWLYFIFTGILIILLIVILWTEFIRSFKPSPLEALVVTTGKPKSMDNLLIFIDMPFLFASSIRFTHTRTLFVISVVWSTRFKFLSKHVASRTITVRSGLPKQMKSLATSSSTELAIRE